MEYLSDSSDTQVPAKNKAGETNSSWKKGDQNKVAKTKRKIRQKRKKKKE